MSLDYWYSKPAADVPSAVFSLIGDSESKQDYRQQDNIRNMRLYGNYEYTSLSAYNYMRVEPTYSVQNRVTFNIVQSCVDTAVSKITKVKPRPYFLTDDGDFTLMRRAQKLTQFTDGVFYATKFYEASDFAFLDACIFGTGAVKIYREGSKICAERTFIDEIVVDDAEAYYGKPRQMHQRKWIHKDVLKSIFPNKTAAIEAATSPDNPAVAPERRRGDMLLVIESWKLATGKKKKDGRHTICIPDTNLFDEKWCKDYFPFVFFRWNLKPLGFFGQGVSEQLQGIQLEINKILRTIQISMHLVSVPKMFIEASSNIVSSHLNNKIGGIIKYVGKKPEEGVLGHVPPELFTHLETLYRRAFELTGISQMSSQSIKPAGLDSGKAIRTFADIESERFMTVVRRREQAHLDASEIMIDMAKDIAEETGNYSVKCPGSSFLKTINWKDVEMDEDQYILQCFPTNALSQDPSSRLAEVQELMQAGLVSTEDGTKLLDFPDLKNMYSMTNAGVNDIDRQIEKMIDSLEYQAPEPYQNLQYGVKKMQQAYLLYRSQGAPEDALELFRRWMDDADNMLKKAQADVAAQQAAMAPQGAPGPIGQPAAQPVSDMLPVAGPQV